jgi:hypothetical protein
MSQIHHRQLSTKHQVKGVTERNRHRKCIECEKKADMITNDENKRSRKK